MQRSTAKPKSSSSQIRTENHNDQGKKPPVTKKDESTKDIDYENEDSDIPSQAVHPFTTGNIFKRAAFRFVIIMALWFYLSNFGFLSKYYKNESA